MSKANLGPGKYVRTPEILAKMSASKKKNPTRYWSGKKVPQDVVEKIKETKRKNGKIGNTQYFKTHKFKGEQHWLWKGEEASYVSLHHWLYRELGKPDTCEHCGTSGLTGYKIHWANKSREYKRVTTDWLRLCAKCHYHYDRK